jgi:hypothetical protein
VRAAGGVQQRIEQPIAFIDGSSSRRRSVTDRAAGRVRRRIKQPAAFGFIDGSSSRRRSVMVYDGGEPLAAVERASHKSSAGEQSLCGGLAATTGEASLSE